MTNTTVTTRRQVTNDGPGKVNDEVPDPTTTTSGPSGRDEMERGSDDDGSFDDFEEIAPVTKRKRFSNEASPSSSKADISLIEVVKSSGKLIPHSVKHWVERYEKNAKFALVELLTMLFEACGAKFHLTEELLEKTGVDDVVVALVELAHNGEAEDYQSSKRKELKNFKENLVLFWDNLVVECQNGPLFDKLLFDKCMDYIVALSCSPPRAYRKVASSVGLQLVTSFITVAKTLGVQRETTQRQLNAEKKKRTEGPRLESLNKRLSMTHEKITVTEEMMRKLFTGLFVHRYRDIDPNIRMTSIEALGVWILSYPSLFLQDLYLKYLGWTLNDKTAGVRKSSILALQNLYEVDDNVPSLGLFTERFSNRMMDLADDIDISVAVSAIGLLKQLLRHHLLSDDDLGPLYDLLIDEPPEIRRAIGALVYDHLIAQKFSNSRAGSKGDGDDSSEVHLGRMLQILREFSTDPILSTYVIDDVWDYMKAMKDWKCIISMLLDENPLIELTDVDATNLIRLLCSSSKKAVGERIVPATDNRKQYYNKAQKDALDNNRRDLTISMMKTYPQLLRKFMSDKEKVPSLVEIILHLKLELYSLKRQEENFKTVLHLIKEAFFKHGEKNPLRSCLKAITYCSTESFGELQGFAVNKLKELEDELIAKLKSATKQVAGGGDEYSLLVNLKRLYELQLAKSVDIGNLSEELVRILVSYRNLDEEVISFLLLNMYLHVAWCFHSMDDKNLSEASLSSLSSKRNILIEQLEYFLDTPCEGQEERTYGSLLAYRVCTILVEVWILFRKSNLSSTKLERLGFCPDTSVLQKFWKLCEQQLNISDETEDEDANNEYIEETNRDVIMIAASKLVLSDAVPKDFLGPEIVSHFAMHGTHISEIVKHLIAELRKTAAESVWGIFLEALKKAYQRHVVELSKSDDEFVVGKSFQNLKDLASRLSGTFMGAARSKHRSDILKVVKDGISFAFVDAPKQLPFLEGAILQFISKLPTSDIVDILKEVQKETEHVNLDEDPSGWRPYLTFVEFLSEKYAKNEGLQGTFQTQYLYYNNPKEEDQDKYLKKKLVNYFPVTFCILEQFGISFNVDASKVRVNIIGLVADEKEGSSVRRRGRPRKRRNIQGKKLFDEQISSEEEDSISASDHDSQEEEENEAPLVHYRRSSSKLRSMRIQQESKDQGAKSGDSGRATQDDLAASKTSGCSISSRKLLEANIALADVITNYTTPTLISIRGRTIYCLPCELVPVFGIGESSYGHLGLDCNRETTDEREKEERSETVIDHYI
ncbi:hypothetical protein GIB67_015360 [Kingdonia uniflora]|uniref:SCD domain-containing protein n=1 Tax=Kingdonia uniflora TaxID=39325 RepID=A0A7J7KYU6_9MAGN|nr:hypothetical protein GIB67_015360 [Kingdonia uniflora]